MVSPMKNLERILKSLEDFKKSMEIIKPYVKGPGKEIKNNTNNYQIEGSISY